MELVRSFLCIEPEEDVRRSIEEWLSDVRMLAPHVKWVRREALHVTLKFCGEENHSRVSQLSVLLRDAFADLQPKKFDIELSGIGAFPSVRRPRVLWIGVGEGQNELCQLHDLIVQAADISGFEDKGRSFHPHITVARIRNPRDFPLELLQRCREKGCDFGRWHAREVVLMRSILSPQGAIYSPIVSFPLC